MSRDSLYTRFWWMACFVATGSLSLDEPTVYASCTSTNRPDHGLVFEKHGQLIEPSFAVQNNELKAERRAH